MQQIGKSGLLLAAAILFAGFDYGACVKCYSCLSSNSAYGKRCEDPFASELQAEECNPTLVQNMSQQLHNVDSTLAQFLSTSAAPGSVFNIPMLCQKIVLTTPDNKTIFYRGCQIDISSEPMCKQVMNLNKGLANVVTVRSCDSCKTDGCNGGSSHSLAASAALAAIVGSFVMRLATATVC